jgi:hypothetical protein
MPRLIESPSYFRFYNRTIRFFESAAGDVEGQKLNTRTGLFETATVDDVFNVLEARDGFDFSPLSEAEFVKVTEEVRSRYFRGEGVVFDIYRRIELFGNAKAEGRQVDPVEWDEIAELWRRSFDIWEDEAVRQATGKPPSFHYARLGSS